MMSLPVFIAKTAILNIYILDLTSDLVIFAGPNPVLMYSDRREIRRLDLKTRDGSNVVSDLTNAIGLDFDWKEQMIYWSDVNDDKIERAHFDGTQREVIVDTGLLAPEGRILLCSKVSHTTLCFYVNGHSRSNKVYIDVLTISSPLDVVCYWY